jgi:hypothetical protein
MSRRSPLEYDVSVSADKRRRARQRGMTGAFETSQRACDWPNCKEKGAYRAPQAPDRLDEFYWFCLEHIREYNRSWDYFADLPADEVERRLSEENVWERPTWKFGEQPKKPMGASPHAEGEAWKRFGFSDPMSVLGENATINPGRRDGERIARRRSLPPTERRALDILGAKETAAKAELRQMFRDQVKAVHPDMNGGDRSEEDRLREVLWAWEILKGSRNFRD